MWSKTNKQTNIINGEINDNICKYAYVNMPITPHFIHILYYIHMYRHIHAYICVCVCVCKNTQKYTHTKKKQLTTKEKILIIL